MIAEFILKNYRSFKEEHKFSLLATKNKELAESHTFDVDNKVQLLKSAVIYGANASGKSNFFNALYFFINFSIYSGPRKQVGDIIDVDPFSLSKQTIDEPSFFELVFFIKDNNGKPIRYRYGFSVTGEEVINEYLLAIQNVREITFFNREKQKMTITDHFREGTRIKSAVRSNCSLLSVAAQSNNEIAAKIIQYFKSILITSGLSNIASVTKRKLRQSDENTKKQVLNFLHYADIHVKDINVKREIIDKNELPPEILEIINKNPGVRPPEIETYFFCHDFYDNEKIVDTASFPEEEESRGTQKLFAYAIPIISALENGTPLFIDEFDAQLHPLILENIIKLFNSSDINKNNAQLIISCHAVHIMTNNNFRRDQIWFCEKDHYGATDLYSLVEYKIEDKDSVRKDSTYNKNYMQGKYGAIPYLDAILWQTGFDK